MRVYLRVGGEPGLGLGTGRPDLGGPAVVREGAGGTAAANGAVGEGGLRGDLVQRELQAFVLRLPEEESNQVKTTHHITQA